MTSVVPIVFDYMIDNIYLGNIVAAQTEFVINMVDTIINISNLRYDENINKKYYHIEIPDKKNIKLTEHFKYFDEIIKENQNKNILIHCQCGISRSVTFVIYYLMKYKKMTMQQSFDFLRCQRKQLSSPNIGFLFQLLYIDKFLHGKPSCKIGVKLIHGETINESFEMLKSY